MKDSILVSFLLFFFFTTYSQDPNVINRDWHIHELFMDGEFVDIPAMPADPPADCILGLHIEPFDNTYRIYLGVCTKFGAVLDNFDLVTFTVDWLGGLLGEGPCYYGSTSYGCTSIPDPNNGQLADFEYIHHNFYEDFQSTFSYIIQPPGTLGYETLHIQKPNGDYALYGEVPLLSVASNNFNYFSIYPNPVSDILHVKGTIQNTKTVTIYSLSGQKINSNMAGGKIDVSEMRTGLYFIEITLESGEKQVQKFIKK